MRRNTAAQIAQWLIFSVAFSLTPFLFLGALTIYDGRPLTLAVLVRNGDLFVVSVVLAAEEIGAQVLSSGLRSVWKLIAVGGLLTVTLFSSVFDALIRSGRPAHITTVRDWSLAAFATTICIVGFCHFRAETNA